MCTELAVLKEFLSKPLTDTNEIFKPFQKDATQYVDDGDQKRFLYIEGSRENKVLLVAHADTVWHGYNNQYKFSNVALEDGIFYSTNELTGIGADDRAGCAMLYLLKNSGHSLLIVDGEENCLVGSNHLAAKYSELLNHINTIHNFAVELDRRGKNDFKCYNVGSNAFREYLVDKTGYVEPELNSFTDIVKICTKITGVNFSIGYYNEHTNDEVLVIDEWLRTLNMLRNLLNDTNIPRFEQFDHVSNSNE